MTLASFVPPHLIAGGLALVLFWVAVFSRKGSLWHRRVGQAFLACMAVVVLSGIPLTLHLYLKGAETFAIFLGYLVILVSLASINSVRAIRYRQDRSAYLNRTHQVSIVILALAGLAVIVVGLNSPMAPILVPFGALGLFSLIGLVRDLKRVEISRSWWLKEHYGNMIGNGIATHIAFSQIGLVRLLPGQGYLVNLLGWLLPLTIGLAAIAVLNRRYRGATVKLPGRPMTAGPEITQ